MPIGAAIGAGIGAIGSIGGSLIQSNAASKASQQQAQASANALALQQGEFNTGKAAVQPFITAGQGALPTLSSLLNPSTASTTLSELPGFQFASQWGTKATQNALASEGLGGSTGPLAAGISQYNTGLASSNYNNIVSQLLGYAGLGANSASSLLSGANTAGAIQGQTAQNIGNAQAAGTLGSANAIAGGLTGAGTSASNALLLSTILGGGGLGGGGGIYGGTGAMGLFGGVPNYSGLGATS